MQDKFVPKNASGYIIRCISSIMICQHTKVVNIDAFVYDETAFYYISPKHGKTSNVAILLVH